MQFRPVRSLVALALIAALPACMLHIDGSDWDGDSWASQDGPQALRGKNRMQADDPLLALLKQKAEQNERFEGVSVEAT